MTKLTTYLRGHPLAVLLLALPVTALGEYAFHWSAVTIFVLAALGIIPLPRLDRRNAVIPSQRARRPAGVRAFDRSGGCVIL